MRKDLLVLDLDSLCFLLGKLDRAPPRISLYFAEQSRHHEFLGDLSDLGGKPIGGKYIGITFQSCMHYNFVDLNGCVLILS